MYKKCDLCEGNGWTAEYSPNCNPYDLCRKGQCPIQKPCQKCNATGYVPYSPRLREVTGLRKKLIDCLNWIDKSTYWKEDNDIPTEFIVDKYLEQMKGGKNEV